MTLPGETKAVTAGKFVLSQDEEGEAVGQFVYGRKYRSREDAVEIDPVELKLLSGTFKTTRLKGVFGALRDSGPDFWGRQVIQKFTRKTHLSELDYLLESPEDRAGALAFGLAKSPPAPTRKYNRTIDLGKMQELADALVQDTLSESEDAIQVKELIKFCTSMGGARPKAVVEDDYGLWVAKFSRPDDPWNFPRIEHAMLDLAQRCGIQSARSKIETIGGKDVLLVQRFDREKTSLGYLKARMISGLTVLQADELPSDQSHWSYVILVEEIRRHTSTPKEAANQLFRRMCFNCLISNTDDHPRNHAIIAMNKEWKLSPAYDLIPVPEISKEQRFLAMECGDQGRFANRKNLLSECTRFLISKEEADSIISEMSKIVDSSWYSVVKSHGVSEKDADSISGAFLYEGFNY